jgi:lycopene cyclase domain-containing protein
LIQEVIPYLYLIALVASIAGIALLDHKHKLVFWADAKASALAIGIGVGVFLVWDIIGIALGIFFRGNAPHLSGLLMGPELPVEELFFLILLCYNTLLVYRWWAKK